MVREPREKRHSHVGEDCIHRSVVAAVWGVHRQPGRKTNTGRAEAGSRDSGYGAEPETGHRGDTGG